MTDVKPSQKPGKCALLEVNALKHLLEQMPEGKKAYVVGNARDQEHRRLLSCLVTQVRQMNLRSGVLYTGGPVPLKRLSLHEDDKKYIDPGLVILPANSVVEGRCLLALVRQVYAGPVLVVDGWKFYGAGIELVELTNLGKPTTMIPLEQFLQHLPAVQGPQQFPANFAVGSYGRRTAKAGVGGMTST